MMTTYLRHPDLRLTALEDEGVVLHLGTLRYFTVNETGLTILNALETPKSLQQLVKVVTDDFDVTDDVAEETTMAFLTQCMGVGLLGEHVQ
jgi:hypothetical protein